MSSWDNWSLWFSNTVFKPWMALGRWLRVAILLPRASQACSIGLDYGDLARQSIREYHDFREICQRDELHVASRFIH
ncbi:hypothetical protein TNCV_407521 [Trichonephila clavipes]|nr:hypothetical protein TNCV_407521 [Trichonephila clavipes]